MSFVVLHDIKKGIRQLLEAPEDLYHLIPHQGNHKPLADATERHQKLYLDYLRDFAVAYEVGDDWWQGCVAAFARDGRSSEEANELAFEKRLAGPASAPEVVWFFRKYWLDFDAVNRSLDPEQRVPPQTAVLGWLVDQKLDDYVRFLTCMPYWPIGLDENGNWC